LIGVQASDPPKGALGEVKIVERFAMVWLVAIKTSVTVTVYRWLLARQLELS